MSEKPFRFSAKPWSIVRENKEYSTPIFNLLKRRPQLESPEENLKGDFYILDAGDGTVHHAIVLAAVARYLLIKKEE